MDAIDSCFHGLTKAKLKREDTRQCEGLYRKVEGRQGCPRALTKSRHPSARSQKNERPKVCVPNATPAVACFRATKSWTCSSSRQFSHCLDPVFLATSQPRASVAILVIVIVFELPYIFGVSKVSTVTRIRRVAVAILVTNIVFELPYMFGV